MYRTAYRNAAGDVGPPGRPELAEQYKELVLKPLHEAQVTTTLLHELNRIEPSFGHRFFQIIHTVLIPQRPSEPDPIAVLVTREASARQRR